MERDECVPQKIVIVGSGFAGLTAAIRLHRKLRHVSHDLLVIDRNATFVYRPSLVLVAFGHKSPESITFDLAKTYARLHIPFMVAEVTQIEPNAKLVHTASGPVTYDKLIVALGEQLAPEEIPGMAEFGYNVCSLPAALNLNRVLQSWTGGPAVVGWSQFVQTGGPTFEVALELRRWMTQRGFYHPIHFIDPLPAMWAPAGPEAGMFLTQLFDQHQIIRHGPVQVQSVARDHVKLTNGDILPSTLTIVTPPFRGVDAQREIARSQPRDWLVTGHDMKSQDFADVYGSGSATAFDGPKQAHTAMRQAEVAVDNLVADLLQSSTPRRDYVHEMSCVLDLGQGEGLFVKRSLWSDTHQETKLGRQWPVAKAALAYAYVKTPVFKRWGLSTPK